MHVPQCIQATIELKYIADVRRQMMNPGSSKPTMGLIHDGIIGGNLLTRDNVKIESQDAMNLLLYTTLKDKKLLELKKNKVYSGRELYSMILPPKLNVHYKKEGKTTFRIINSKLTEDGAMTKQQLGASKNSLIHHVWNQYRHVYTKRFLDDTRRLVTQWLKINGFSVGMREMILDPKLRKQFETMISIKKFETNQLITEMENNNVLRDFKLFETQIQSELNVLRDNIGKLVMNNLTAENGFNVMISSEARGTIMNMGQMVGCVGQQNIETKRVQKKMNGRTLPCYYHNDDGMDARGFVSSCFLYGLTPQEFFFHTMSGREGMIDTAIKSVTGDTPIIIVEDEKSKYVKIGEWINEKLNNNAKDIKFSERSNQELLNLSNNVYIPSTDSQGNVRYNQISAVTRHDPTDSLYEIKTASGRSVTVVESKSLLIWDILQQKFEPVFTPEIKIGDYMPTTANLTHNIIINKPIKVDNNILQLELNESNGTFIGLFLSCGVFNKDHIVLSCKGENIETFVKEWFNKNNIKYTCLTKGEIISNNIELADLLAKITNNNNCVPNESYSAPKEFIKGLLSGFFSNCLLIRNSTIWMIPMKSEQLVNGINMLCSRFGVFTTSSHYIIDENKFLTLSIESEWTEVFAKQIKLLDVNKQTKLDTHKQEYKDYKICNDVVLDEIVEINIFDNNQSKVYDLTVPNTLNFALANGLNVRDTAETGYIQRKLVKALEDFMVKYDGTVRNARDLLTQCIYGESGIDLRYQVEQKISFIGKNNKEIKNEYLFNDNELKKYKMTENRNTEVYNRMIELRDTLRWTQEKSVMNYSVLKDTYMYGVDLKTMIENYKTDDTYKKGALLDGSYVANTISTLLNNKYTPVMKMSEKQANDPTSFKYRDEQLAKIVLEAGLYEYLAPKRCCVEYEFNKEQFDALVEDFIEKFKRAIIQPGEMVGTLAAQSIGEPATQLSCSADTLISIYKSGKIINSTIGQFIDNQMKNNKDYYMSIEGSDIMPLDKDDDIKILSVGKNEKVKWCNVTELSRHPPYGNMIRVKTVTGREIEATLSHSFLKRTKDGVEPIEGKKLKIGDRIPIALKTPLAPKLQKNILVGTESYKLDKKLCQFIGFFVTEGSTCEANNNVCITSNKENYQKITKEIYKRFTNNEIKERDKDGYIMSSAKKYKGHDTYVNCTELSKYLRKNCGTYCINKHVPSFVFQLDLPLIGKFLRGLFDGDGNVHGNRKSVKYHSISKLLIEQVALLLSYFGIMASYQIEREAFVDDEGHVFQDLWVLLIFGAEQGKIFYENIGTEHKYKDDQFKKYIHKTDAQQYIEQIPNVACYINTVGRGLQLRGASRNYGRWVAKEAKGCCIGKRTLRKYVDLFKEEDVDKEYTKEIKKLEQAINADVFWDQIVELEIYGPDEDDKVYDFSVEGNETFVIQNGMYVHNTLNSIDFKERILLKNKNGKLEDYKIGEFINTKLQQESNKVTKIENGDQYYLETKEEEYKIMSIDADGNTSWKLIEAVTKHLPLYNDKIDKLVKVTTEMGRTCIGTKAKSFLVYAQGKVVPINGADLKTGMRVPILHNLQLDDSEIIRCIDNKISLDSNFGYSIGQYLARGYINETREHAQLIIKECGNPRVVPTWCLNASIDFVRELLNGYFKDGHGAKENTCFTTMCMSEELMKGVQTLLYRFNIFGSYARINIGKKNDKIISVFTLSIKKEFIKRLIQNIPSVSNYKITGLEEKIKECKIEDKLEKERVSKLSIKEILEELDEQKERSKLSPMCLEELSSDEIKSYDGLSTYVSDMTELYDKTINTMEYDILINNGEVVDMHTEYVYYDKIVKLQEVESSNKYVYDLTIAETRNFYAVDFPCADTFHTAGTGAKTTGQLGVPRLRELMSLSKNPKTPQMSIYLNDVYKNDKNMAHRIASNLRYTTINDVTKNIEIIYDPNPFKEGSIMEKDGVDNVYMTLSPTKVSCQTDITGLPWLIRIVIDRESMLEKEITLLDIQTKFCEFWSARYNDTRGMKREDKMLMEKVVKCSILANFDNVDVPIIHIRLDMQKFDKNTLLLFKDTVLHKLKLKGISGITEILGIVHEPYVAYAKDGTVEKHKRYVIYVSGVNLGDIRYVKGIDQNKVLTNHVTEMYNWYGMEVARRGLIKEFKSILEANGSSTNFQHWAMLVEAMTLSTMLISIDRNGMTKLDSDPLPRASFEKTVEQITIASVFREVDSMASVSARIMTGQMINGGTGLCRLFLNTKLLESTDLPDTSKDWHGKKFKKVTKDKIVKDLLDRPVDENDFNPD
jgi:DNA-directed RNA polymerase beta' subunit